MGTGKSEMGNKEKPVLGCVLSWSSCMWFLTCGCTFLDTLPMRSGSMSPLLESQWAYLATSPPRLGHKRLGRNVWSLSLSFLQPSSSKQQSSASKFKARFFFGNSNKREPSEYAMPLAKEIGSRMNMWFISGTSLETIGEKSHVSAWAAEGVIRCQDSRACVRTRPQRWKGITPWYHHLTIWAPGSSYARSCYLDFLETLPNNPSALQGFFCLFFVFF